MSQDVYLKHLGIDELLDDDVEPGSDWGDWDDDEVPDEDQYLGSNIHSYCPKFLQCTIPNQMDNKRETQQHSKLDKWTSSDVITFIISLNPEYEIYRTSLSTVFAKQNVKGTSLSLIREHHLESFGISNHAHCSAIYSKIHQLVEKEKEKENCVNSKVFADSMVKMRLQKERINVINLSIYLSI